MKLKMNLWSPVITLKAVSLVAITLLSFSSAHARDESLPDWYTNASGGNVASACIDSKGSMLITEKLAALSARSELANRISTQIKESQEYREALKIDASGASENQEQFKVIIDSLAKADLIGSAVTKRATVHPNKKEVFCVEVTISPEDINKSLLALAAKNNLTLSPGLKATLKSSAYTFNK